MTGSQNLRHNPWAEGNSAENGRHTSDTTIIAQNESRKESGDVGQSVQRPTNTEQMHDWTWRVVAMTFLVSLGGMVFGYGGIGQIGGFLLMEDYRRRFGTTGPDGLTIIDSTKQGSIVGVLMIGAFFGSLFAGPNANKFGRKNSISVSALFFLIGSLIEISSHTAWYQIFIGRAVEGWGIGGLSILMYQSECAPKELRGVIISMYQLFITLGILLASSINLGTKHIHGSASWRTTVAIGLLWPLMLGIGIQFLDESPRWDIRHNRFDRARLTLSKIYSTDTDVDQEFSEIQNAVQSESEREKASITGLWNEPTILRRVLAGMVLQMMQQLTGINYFFYFGTELFSHLNVGDSYITSVILGTVNFGATFLGLWIAKRFGHRDALVSGGIWIGVWLLLFSFFGQYCIEKVCPIPATSAGASMVVFACMAIIGFAATWGPLTWVVCAEIFPSRWKAFGMGAATGTNWIFNFLIGFFTTAVTNKIQFGLGWVFAGSIICGAGFVWFCVHETAGKSLEAIDKEILDGVKPWDTKKGQ